MRFKMIVAASLVGALFAVPGYAEGLYVSGTVGASMQADSDNTGATSADFQTGNGGAIPAGTPIASGTSVGWKTEFDNGTSYSAAIGYRYTPSLRAEVQLTNSKSDVDTHKSVTLGGGSIDGLDAAALTGSADTLGVTVADVVADGRGDIKTTAIFLNGYYDFTNESPFTPYVGAGLGYAKTDVTFKPSGVGIIDDNDSGLAYQVMAGLTYEFGERWDVFGQYTYRSVEDGKYNVDLFPAQLEVENKSNLIEVGVRYKF